MRDIYSRPAAPTVTLYKLEDLLGEKIKGVFYRRQLQKVLLPDKPIISKIIRNDKRRGYLVKLQNYPADYSLWLSREEIKDGYGLADVVRLTSMLRTTTTLLLSFLTTWPTSLWGAIAEAVSKVCCPA